MGRARLAAIATLAILSFTFAGSANADPPCDPLDPVCVGGTTDLVPPNLTGLSVSPSSIDGSSSLPSDRTVNLTATGTDDLSGIYYVSASFRLVGETSSQPDTSFPIWIGNLSGGTPLNGTLTGTGTVNQYSLRPGQYKIAYLSICDHANRCSNYTGTDLDTLGLNPEIGVNPPEIACDGPPASWVEQNVVVSCTASDAQSGLANPSDSSFSLSTSVAPNVETHSAFTNSRLICNVAGACVTAGPISGIKVDRKAPSISIDGPVDGAVFHQGDSVVADYSCSDGGSGVADCVGDVADGSAIDTSSLGSHSFTVTSTDAVGNTSSKTVHYTVVAVGAPDLRITKSSNPAYARPGDTLSFTLVAENAGTEDAENVVITDPLPAGLTFVSASAPCQFNSGTVTCEIGTLAGGQHKTYTVTTTVDDWGDADESADHLLDVQRNEVQVDLEAGQTRTLEVSCPAGYLAVDGSLRVDHVDQGTGDWTAPEVLESRAGSLSTWRATVRNTAHGQAQAKLFVVCVQKVTLADGTNRHEISLSAPVVLNDDVTAGRGEHLLECGPGEIAVQPGFSSDQAGNLVYSQPEGNGWKFIFDASADAHVSFSIACLKRQTTFEDGHTHDFRFERISTTVDVAPGTVNEAQLTCPDGSKGIVAGWDLDNGLFSLGNDPRPVTRAFKLYNPTDHTLGARLTLLCLGTRTAGEHLAAKHFANTAFITSSSVESDPDNNDSTVEVPAEDTDNHTPVVNDPDPDKPHPNNPIAKTIVVKGVSYSASGVTFTLKCSGACGGTAKLSTLAKIKVKDKKYSRGTVIGKRQYFIGKAGTKKVKLTLTGNGRRILRSGKAHRALLTVSGTAAKRVGIG